MTEAGVGEVVDFMPVTTSTVASSRHRIVRIVRCVRGDDVRRRHRPRFDYGRESHEVHLTEDGAVFRGSRTALTVNLVLEPDERLARTRVDDNGDLHAEVTWSPGRCVGPCWRRARRVPRAGCGWPKCCLDETVAFWKAWLGQSTYTGRWRRRCTAPRSR